uniref:Vesicle trafficking protein (SEC7 homologue), putative n=1 Tax=Theileria annulata TaxID=5874 RepID=A0A3B0MZI6_THEAN
MKERPVSQEDTINRNNTYRNGNLSIQTIKQDAYNVLSVLKSYVNNISGYSATSNLVPILGTDFSVLKTNEQRLIKKFKKLTSVSVTEERKYLELEHLQPFFEVFKTFDTRYVKLLIICVESLANLARNDLLCFEEKDASLLVNKIFTEVLNVFANVLELKEDFLLLKTFDCFEHLFRSYYGNLITNENMYNLLKLILSLLSNRNRNAFFKKVFYTKAIDLLLSAFGNTQKYGGQNKELYRRVNTVCLFLSLMSGISIRFNSLGYHIEDSYLCIGDKDTMLVLRSHLTPILTNLSSVPTNFSEFADDMRRMSLLLFNNAIECKMLDLSNVNLVPILQSHFSHSLYKLFFTESITLYSLVLRSFWNLYISFRFYLKSQVELFLNHMITSVMNQISTAKRSRIDILEMNLEFLEELSKNSYLLLEMYLNYDCDVKCSNLFNLFAKCLVMCLSINNESEFNANKFDHSKSKKGPAKNNTKKTTTQYKSTTNSSENLPQLNLEMFSLNVLQNIVKFAIADQTLYSNPNPNNCSNYQTSREEDDKIKEKNYKEMMMKCSLEFNNSKADEWIESAKNLGVLSKYCTENEVALFLKYSPELDLKKVGEYLATHKNPKFMDMVRANFCELNHFAGVPIVMAIRTFLSSFRLPGESQQIERLIEAFAKIYFKSQPLVNDQESEVSNAKHEPKDLNGTKTQDPSLSSEDSDQNELKLARWVIQEDFYHKHRPIQQKCSQFDFSGDDSSNCSDLETSGSFEGCPNNNNHSGDVDKTDEATNSCFDYTMASNWTNNNDMYKYFLSNEVESLICRQNYEKICQYLKNTPVTMETQSTINDINNNGETETNRSSFNNVAPVSESGKPTNSSANTTLNSQVGNEKVKLEHKPGFAYIQDYNAIFVLCYSIIMLNTDLHNSQIKNKMKLEDFIRNNRGTNDGKNFPSEFLQDIYKTIKYHEIKLHSSLTLNNSTHYEPYLWSDYVLPRQKQLSPYVQLTTTDNIYEVSDEKIKKEKAGLMLLSKLTDGGFNANFRLQLFEVLLNNKILEFLDQLFSYCRNVQLLKKTVELFWLIVSLALKYSRHDLVNKVFQLPSIDVSYSMGYKCQISISFILNMLAVCSEYFDESSWQKMLDIVTGFYCLNLLPPTFAALDGDHRLFASNTYADLSVPSIRFKRITDKKSNGWLVGLSNLMVFTKGSSPEALKALNKYNVEGEDAETFLFLFDVQASSDELVQNKFFDVYLLRNKFSPVYSSEDEATINNVTKTLSSESDREELLPPILTYINLRLAFLNIYKLDDLFMGAILTCNHDSFKLFLSVIMDNILSHSSDGGKYSDRYSDGERDKDGFGSILDPNHSELDQFRDNITSIFNLGIFSRLTLLTLTNSYNHQDNSDDTNEVNGTNGNDKKRMVLTYFIELFYIVARKMVVKNSVKYLPTREGLYQFFNLSREESLKKFDSKVPLDDKLPNYVTFILLNLVFWFIDHHNTHRDLESPSSNRFIEHGNSNNLQNNTDKTQKSVPKDGAEVIINVSGWLLHLFINFDNSFFGLYLEPFEKLLYNLADSYCLSRNVYMVSLVLCSIQRMVNPHLPFGAETLKLTTTKTSTSILTLLLRRSKCVTYKNPMVAKLAAQTLLSIALFMNINSTLPSAKQNNYYKEQKQTNRDENKNKEDKDKYTENLLAIQLLIEFEAFANDENKENLEHLWLLSVHCLSIIFSIGPHEISNEAMKGLNKLLLQQPYPKSKSTLTSQISRIFDYILSPMVTLNFCYPLPKQIQSTLSNKDEKEFDKNTDTNEKNRTGDYTILGPFSNNEDGVESLWMSGVMNEYLNNFAFKDFDDLATRKATATNLICHALLSKLTQVLSEQCEPVDPEVLKSSASSLECLL